MEEFEGIGSIVTEFNIKGSTLNLFNIKWKTPSSDKELKGLFRFHTDLTIKLFLVYP